jgi:hypothetical protein
VGFLTTTADKKGINIYFFFETGGVQIPHPPDQKKREQGTEELRSKNHSKIIQNPSKSSRN